VRITRPLRIAMGLFVGGFSAAALYLLSALGALQTPSSIDPAWACAAFGVLTGLILPMVWGWLARAFDGSLNAG
jgi:predicted membrane-bound spermidine synthase